MLEIYNGARGLAYGFSMLLPTYINVSLLLQWGSIDKVMEFKWNFENLEVYMMIKFNLVALFFLDV
jgi:hypothetical protein